MTKLPNLPEDFAGSLILRMFRRGQDTATIAKFTGLIEAVVERELHKALVAERARDAEWLAAGEPR